jgi:hypothetical protein
MPPVEPPPGFPEVSVFATIPSDILAAMIAIEEMYVSRIWLPVPMCILNLPIDISDTSDQCPFVFDRIMSLLYMQMIARGWAVDPIDYTNFNIYLKTALLLDRAKDLLANISANQTSLREALMAL